MGAEAWRRSPRLLSTAHENEVGQLQSSSATHPHQYGTREEAQGLARVRGRARDASHYRADPQRAISHADDEVLPVVARGQRRTKRAAAGSRGLERITPQV